MEAMGVSTAIYNIPRTPIRGVEKYAFFWESYLEKHLEAYREGKISGEDIAELCTGRNTYNLYHIVDIWKDGNPIDRRLFRTDGTLNRLAQMAKEKGYALLYRGFFAIPGEVWNEYRQKKQEGKAKRLEIFKLEKLTRLAPHILIDTDAKQGMTFEKLKKLIKYLHKLRIYPEVWESASGKGNHHIYIPLVGMVEKFKVRNESGVEEERRKYYLPYASDYRLELVIEALKELFLHLNIPYDSISTDRAVWLEGFPNPEKGGRASRKIWNGKPHRLDSLFGKLKPFWEKKLREDAKKEYYTFKALTNERTRLKKITGVGSVEICEEDHSNPIDYLQANVAPTFRMLDKGYTWFQIEQQLRAGWSGDQKAFDRAFKGFESWINTNYRPPKKNPKETKPNHKRKHTHYWEHIPKIHEVLQQDGLNSSLNHIHRKTQISKGTLSNIFKIVSKEQILSSPKEAQELLKAYQKGGDRMTTTQKEEARKRAKEKWEAYLDKFLEESIKARKKPLGDKGKKTPKKPFKEALVNLKGVQIGHTSITPMERKAGEGERKKEVKVKNPSKNQQKPTKNPIAKAISQEDAPTTPPLRTPTPPEEPPTHEEPPPTSEELERELQKELKRAEERRLKKKAWEAIEKLERIWEIRVGYVPEGKGHIRLVFGAVYASEKGKKRTYDLSRWGSFAEALEKILRELGHFVVRKKKPTPVWEDFQPNLPMPSSGTSGGEDIPIEELEELLDF